jgi:hypothetical protein
MLHRVKRGVSQSDLTRIRNLRGNTPLKSTLFYFQCYNVLLICSMENESWFPTAYMVYTQDGKHSAKLCEVKANRSIHCEKMKACLGDVLRYYPAWFLNNTRTEALFSRKMGMA